MQQHSGPDVAQLATRLASDQARVAEYVDTLVNRLDELVAATGRADYHEVRRISGEIADAGRASGHRAISALAQRVCDEAHQPENDLAVKRSLIRLIGTCGRADRWRTSDA